MSADYSSSALRFGLVDIRPVQVVETVKRFGLKFRRFTRRFETLKPSESYSDFVTLRNQMILAKIDIPDRFDAEKLVEIISQRSVKLYEEDTELQEAVGKIRKSDRMGKPLLSFVQFAMNRFGSKREKYLESEAARFLCSNLPLSFYNKFVVLDNTYYDFLSVLEQEVRLHEFRARTARSFEMYRKKIEKMKRSIAPIIDQMDDCLFISKCLMRYLSIWNATTYEEILKPNFFDIQKIDYSRFKRMNNQFKTQLIETRAFLLKYNRDLLHRELNLENKPTAKMFGQIVMLPPTSLSLER